MNAEQLHMSIPLQLVKAEVELVLLKDFRKVLLKSKGT
jgi:hypothetical protein